jgi:hypothetical protein
LLIYHDSALSNLGIPLASSTSAGFSQLIGQILMYQLVCLLQHLYQMTAAFDGLFDDIPQELLIMNNHNYVMNPALAVSILELEPGLYWAQGGLNPCPTGYEPVALPD